MTGVRWRKVRADLTTNRLRSGLAVLSLAVGTTAVGAMLLAGTTVDASFSTGFAATNAPSAMLVTAPFTPALVDDVRAHPAVADVEARRLHQVQATGPTGDLVGVELVSMPDFSANHVAMIDPDSGTWPPPPDGIVLERASAAELGTDVGDEVTIHVAGQAPRRMRVRGTALDAFEVAPMLGGQVRGYVAMETMVDLAGSDDLNALYLRATGDPADRARAQSMTVAVRDDVLSPAGVAIEANAVDDPGVHRADNALSFLVLAMQLLSVLALVVAIALVVNTVAALLAQQRSQVGMMKAIGATTRQLTGQYLAYVALLSAVAVLVSIPASLLLGTTVAGFVADLANIDLVPVGVPITAIAVQVAIATLLPLGAVVFAVRRTAGMTVREAISDPGLAGPTSQASAHVPASRPTTLALRNAIRNRTRMALTVLTVALCGGVLVGVISTGAGLGRLGDQVAGYRDYDVELALGEPVVVDEAADLLGDDPAVASVEGWVRGQATRPRVDGTTSEGIDLLGVPPETSSLHPTLLAGQWLDTDDADGVDPIVINTHLADAEPDLEVGDSMVLDVHGQRHPWRIVGIATTTLVGPVAYTPADTLAAVTSAPGRATVLTVQLTEGTDQAAAAERLGSLALDAGLPVAQVQTRAEIRAATDGLFDIAVALLLLVGIVLAVVAAIGVAGTVTLGVVEQTREIGVLRTLGATNWAVRKLLLAQGISIAVVGGLVGVVLSVPVVVLLGSAIQRTLISAEFPTTFSWPGAAAWLGVAVAIGAIGAIQPARVASRMTVRDTLAYE